jgi:hypothetical protein
MRSSLGEILSYEDLKEAVDFAGFALGIGHATRSCSIRPTRPSGSSLAAILKLGAVAVPITPIYTSTTCVTSTVIPAQTIICADTNSDVKRSAEGLVTWIVTHGDLLPLYKASGRAFDRIPIADWRKRGWLPAINETKEQIDPACGSEEPEPSCRRNYQSKGAYNVRSS